ncbi:MAG: hypothetical protein Q9174_000125 [Haloplaca sp. 1 TL-2023]
MANCHSLRSIDGELVGDPLDLKMFGFTDWSFTEGSHDPFSGQLEEATGNEFSTTKPPPGLKFEVDEGNGSANSGEIQLSIIKGFEFVSQLRRASIIVCQARARFASIYVKGAPECMKDICKPETCEMIHSAVPSYGNHSLTFTVPVDYEDLLEFYTHRGFRVIACATKQMALDSDSLRSMQREDAEKGLDFTGFIVFENKLKAATAQTIEELEQAGIRQVMCTGDNILTAVSVARECALIDRTAHCFIPRLVEGNLREPNARVKWHSVDNPLFELDEKTLKPQLPPPDGDVSLPYDMSDLRNYNIAVTGDIFRWIVDFGEESVLQRMLVATQVFARMSPDEKHELVEKLQTIDYCCGFCGDGANDCGALKAADVGISLSEAEASVAAPFTSRVFDISCVPEVIRRFPGQLPSNPSSPHMLNLPADKILPHSQITAFSNSRTQKKYIDQQANFKGLSNLRVITGDVVDYEFEAEAFDRVVSIELFEHMKNYELLMAKVSRALKPGGKLFVHIFCHKTTPYDFQEGWMSTHFFSGGTMPSADLLHYFQKDLTLTRQWWVNGKHYAKTCEDWLSSMSNNKKTIWPHLESTYGKDSANTWFQRWQIFYLACAELFAYEGGDTWGVSHYLFEKGVAG